MSLPAIRAVREAFPGAQIAVLARPWVADLYARETAIDGVLPYTASAGWRDIGAKRRIAAELKREQFDIAILLANSFEAALIARMAAIPRRIGYARDGRGWLLTDAIPVPETGEIPRHERFYYLELLRRAGVIEHYPACECIRLEGRDEACAAGSERMRAHGLDGMAIGVSPGAAYGGAKRWPADRFSEVAIRLARELNAGIALFGSAGERAICDQVAEPLRSSGIRVHNFAGETSLAQFIELAAACRLFLTNDSGAMHIVSALGVPSVTIFGPTDHNTTGPTGASARIVREPVECSPCLLRECPIDHRCMTRVTPDRVAATALKLWRETGG